MANHDLLETCPLYHRSSLQRLWRTFSIPKAFQQRNGICFDDAYEYTYRVKAYSSKDSSWSSEVTIQTPSYILATPAISALTNTGTNTVLVQWKDNDSRYSYIYVYRRAKGEANYQLLGQTDDYNKQFEDNTVVPSQTYYYKLLSSDGTYSSDYSDSVAITTKSFSLSAPSLNTEYLAGSFNICPDSSSAPGITNLLTERIDLARQVSSAVSETDTEKKLHTYELFGHSIRTVCLTYALVPSDVVNRTGSSL